MTSTNGPFRIYRVAGHLSPRDFEMAKEPVSVSAGAVSSYQRQMLADLPGSELVKYHLRKEDRAALAEGKEVALNEDVRLFLEERGLDNVFEVRREAREATRENPVKEEVPVLFAIAGKPVEVLLTATYIGEQPRTSPFRRPCKFSEILIRVVAPSDGKAYGRAVITFTDGVVSVTPSDDHSLWAPGRFEYQARIS
ncbi:hypothetical protein ACIQZN_24870 [Streptomyces sp. NPDC097595]|uniref:hypothetical protein n=1 Tax=Streptomyces sp. NPDC097595 TaxID=3366090 RepID=UPI00382AC031